MFSGISEDLKNETIENTCTKHNITFKELVEWSLRNTLPADRYSDINKYIYKVDSGYAIKKSIKAVYSYFGVYDSIEDARNVRDKLIDCNWDKNQLPSIVKELGVKNNGNGE